MVNRNTPPSTFVVAICIGLGILIGNVSIATMAAACDSIMCSSVLPPDDALLALNPPNSNPNSVSPGDVNSPFPSESIIVESPPINETPTPSHRPTPQPTDPTLASPSVSPTASPPTPMPSASPSQPQTTAPTPTPTPSPSESPSPQPTTSEAALPSEYAGFVPDLRTEPRASIDRTPHFTTELRAYIGMPVGEAEMDVDAFGLLPGSSVTLELRSNPLSLGAATVDADGTLRISAALPANVPSGAHTILARGEALPGVPLPTQVVRMTGILVDADGRIIGITQDLRAVPDALDPPPVPKEPVVGRGGTAIVTTQGGSLVYIDERISTSATAAALRTAGDAFGAPSTFSGGIVTVLLLAMFGILLELPFNLVQERAKAYYLQIVSRFRRNEAEDGVPRLLGVRADVFAFLLVGQLIAGLNAPLEELPPLTQVLQSAIFGSVAVFAISGWYALPQVLAHRRSDGDVGDFHPEWPSLIIAVIALLAAQMSGIVPGFLIGLFTVRRFRSVLPEAQTGRGAWIATILLVALAFVAWVTMDAIGWFEPNATAPLRIVADGVLGIILVAGSQGALLNLLDPGDGAAMSLRRTAPRRWLVAIAASGGLSFALLANGEIDIALFSPPTSLGEYASLLLFALVSLAAIAGLNRLVAARRLVKA